MATQAQLAAVQQLYVGYLGRAADSAGQQFWANAIANGTATIASVATGFTLSAEYKAAYGGLTTDALVEKVYNNVLGRTPDAEGKAFWVAALANGTVKADTLVATIVTNLGALDQQTINNKVFVAQTYTDTVGDAYTPAGGAQVLVGVDSTAASVATAVAAISNGTLPGQVPALGLINAVDAAQAAVATFATENTATADALVAKLAGTKTLAGADQTTATDTVKADADATFAEKVAAIDADATLFRKNISSDTTTVLTTKASDAQTALDKQYASLTTTQKAAADKYVAAIATEAAAKAAAPTDVQKGTVVGGLDADTTADVALADHGNSAATLYTDYIAANAAGRLAIDKAFAGSTYYSTFKETVAKAAAYSDAQAATTTAKAGVDATYVSDLTAKTTADTTLAAAKVADADVASAKALVDAYAAKTEVANDAAKALNDFSAFGVAKHSIAVDDTTHAVTVTDADVAGTVKDVFYFASADKVNITGASDAIVANFAAGDSLVLGNGTYSYNSGALSTGDNNKLEFFLVQSNDGLQVVLETTKYGSSDVTTDATTGAITSGSADHAAVITLTGVALADVTVNNGVISHVA